MSRYRPPVVWPEGSHNWALQLTHTHRCLHCHGALVVYASERMPGRWYAACPAAFEHLGIEPVTTALIVAEKTTEMESRTRVERTPEERATLRIAMWEDK